MFLRRALAAFGDRLFQLVAVHFDAAADRHVVDRDPRVLAEQVLVVLGHFDVEDHRAEYGFAGRVGLGRVEPPEAFLDVGRQQLERADVELLAGFFDFF
jgi:hypothetical protein